MKGTERFWSWVVRRCVWLDLVLASRVIFVVGFAYLVELVLALFWVVHRWCVAKVG